MRLDFKILWVEDQPDGVQNFQESIERELQALGFVLEVIFAEGFNEVQKFLDGDLGDDDIDLILVDFDLGNSGGNGGDAASKIRDKFQHREMIFYSGKSPKDLRQVAADEKIDGVYFAQRPTLDDDVLAVIENMLRKVIDISHMRGIVLAETSELDYRIELSLEAVYKGLDPDVQRKFHGKVVDVIRNRYDHQLVILKKLSDPSKFSELLGRSLLMTAKDKTRALLRFLKSAADLEGRDEHKAAILGYQDNFQDVRNVLAHGMVIEKDGKKVFRGRDQEIDDDRMRQWRLDLVGHRDGVVRVVNSLAANPDGSL